MIEWVGLERSWKGKGLKGKQRIWIGRFKYVHEDALDEEYKKVDEELTAQIANAFVKEGR